MTDYASLIPISVVTGFLGSGKTTLLRQLLSAPSLRETAVLVNEFGEIGLDHHLLQHVSESILLVENGCLCCAVRGDLSESLRKLYSQRERQEVPYFKRVVIETSGLADPVPIAFTVLTDAVLQHHFRLGNIIATIDAVIGSGGLVDHPESVKQAAVADRLVLTKTDLCGEGEVEPLVEELRQLNSSAPIIQSDADRLDAEFILAEDMYHPDGKAREAALWRQAVDGQSTEAELTDHGHGHGGIYSFCLQFDQPLDWTAFGIWMSMLLHRHGENVLRLKGMLNVRGQTSPVLINGVQHIVHPPEHLDHWPDADQRSRIIFIVCGLSREKIENSLAVFNLLANSPAMEGVLGHAVNLENC